MGVRHKQNYIFSPTGFHGENDTTKRNSLIFTISNSRYYKNINNIP